jgi:hypothetical protein
MPNKTWGNKPAIIEKEIVDQTTEIPIGDYAYVFNQQQEFSQVISEDVWNQFLNGNMQDIKDKIETEIPNVQVTWINLYWDEAIRVLYPDGTPMPYFTIKGLRIEAIVKNLGASLTGLEIVAIIVAIAFVAVIITYVALQAWVVWRVISATEQIGPIATVGVGLIIFVVIGVFLLLLFGVKFETGKGKVKVGR